MHSAQELSAAAGWLMIQRDRKEAGRTAAVGKRKQNNIEGMGEELRVNLWDCSGEACISQRLGVGTF